MKITRQTLEESVVVATTKNNDIFETLTPNIELIAELVIDNVLGDVGMEAIEDGKHNDLLKAAQWAICREAFLDSVAHLDLVLTATGFGVVNTQDTAPASRQRVEALRDMVSRQWLKSFSHLVNLLIKVDGWGDTAQAEAQIHNVFYSFDHLVRYSSNGSQLSETDWQKAQPLINQADDKLRWLVSDEEMKDLLSRLRCSQLTETQNTVVEHMRRFIGTYIVSGHFPVTTGIIGHILRTMEENIDDFLPYKNSLTYKARHFQDYENTKDSPLFIFNG
jgi:hypothetical protein